MEDEVEWNAKAREIDDSDGWVATIGWVYDPDMSRDPDECFQRAIKIGAKVYSLPEAYGAGLIVEFEELDYLALREIFGGDQEFGTDKKGAAEKACQRLRRVVKSEGSKLNTVEKWIEGVSKSKTKGRNDGEA